MGQRRRCREHPRKELARSVGRQNRSFGSVAEYVLRYVSGRNTLQVQMETCLPFERAICSSVQSRAIVSFSLYASLDTYLPAVVIVVTSVENGELWKADRQHVGFRHGVGGELQNCYTSTTWSPSAAAVGTSSFVPSLPSSCKSPQSSAFTGSQKASWGSFNLPNSFKFQCVNASFLTFFGVKAVPRTRSYSPLHAEASFRSTGRGRNR